MSKNEANKEGDKNLPQAIQTITKVSIHKRPHHTLSVSAKTNQCNTITLRTVTTKKIIHN